MDLQLFQRNRQQFPPEELAKYAGQYIAWSADGAKILAADRDELQLAQAIQAAGYRALNAGTTLRKVLAMAAELDVPLFLHPPAICARTTSPSSGCSPTTCALTLWLPGGKKNLRSHSSYSSNYSMKNCQRSSRRCVIWTDR